MQDLFVFMSHHLALSYLLGVCLFLLMVIEFLRSKQHRYSIHVSDAIHLINREHAVVIDLRPSEAYSKGHIIDALSLSSNDIQNNPKKMEKFKSKPLIFVCQSGMESQKIAPLLLKQGYNTHTISGGMRAWLDAEMPVVKE